MDTSKARFLRATALAIDPFRNMYVLDAGKREVVKLDPKGAPTARTGGPGWVGSGVDAPKDVAATGLDVYVADDGARRVVRFDRELGLVAEGQPGGASTEFGRPRSVALSRFGDLFVVDAENERILQYPRDGGDARIFGDFRGGKGSLSMPLRVRVTGGDLVVVQDSASIVLFDIFGNFVRRLARDVVPQLRTFAVDDKNIYVLDGCSIVILDAEGTLVSRIALSTDDGWPPCDEIVDIQVQHRILTVLTATMAVSGPFPVPAR